MVVELEVVTVFVEMVLASVELELEDAVDVDALEVVETLEEVVVLLDVVEVVVEVVVELEDQEKVAVAKITGP